MSAKLTVNDLIKLTTNLTSAIEVVSQVADEASSTCKFVATVTHQSHENLLGLEEETDFTGSSEFKKLHDAIRALKESAESVQLRCLDLKRMFDSVCNSLKQGGREKGQENLRLLQEICTRAQSCNESYEKFKDNLHHIVEADCLASLNLRPSSKGMLSVLRRTFSEVSEAKTAVKKAGQLDKPGNKGTQRNHGLLEFTKKAFEAAASAADGKAKKLAPEFDNLKESLRENLADVEKLGDCVKEFLRAAQAVKGNIEMTTSGYETSNESLSESRNIQMKAELEELRKKQKQT